MLGLKLKLKSKGQGDDHISSVGSRRREANSISVSEMEVQSVENMDTDFMIS